MCTSEHISFLETLPGADTKFSVRLVRQRVDSCHVVFRRQSVWGAEFGGAGRYSRQPVHVGTTGCSGRRRRRLRAVRSAAAVQHRVHGQCTASRGTVPDAERRVRGTRAAPGPGSLGSVRRRPGSPHGRAPGLPRHGGRHPAVPSTRTWLRGAARREAGDGRGRVRAARPAAAAVRGLAGSTSSRCRRKPVYGEFLVFRPSATVSRIGLLESCTC